MLRTGVEVLGQTGHVVDILSLSGRREIAYLHVFEHALSQLHQGSSLERSGIGVGAQPRPSVSQELASVTLAPFTAKRFSSLTQSVDGVGSRLPSAIFL